MRLVYGNITWFLALIAGLIYMFYYRAVSPEWESMGEVRTFYNIFYGVVIILLATSIALILWKNNYGYKLAVELNLSLGLLILAQFTIVLIMLPEIGVLNHVQQSVQNLVVSVVCLIFWYFLKGKSLEHLSPKSM
jgi:predicted Kef-type K+ transport protein